MTLIMNDIEKLSKEEILDKLNQNERDLVKLRFKLAANSLKDTTIIKKTRRDIARLNTQLSKMN